MKSWANCQRLVGPLNSIFYGCHALIHWLSGRQEGWVQGQWVCSLSGHSRTKNTPKWRERESRAIFCSFNRVESHSGQEIEKEFCSVVFKPFSGPRKICSSRIYWNPNIWNSCRRSRHAVVTIGNWGGESWGSSAPSPHPQRVCGFLSSSTGGTEAVRLWSVSKPVSAGLEGSIVMRRRTQNILPELKMTQLCDSAHFPLHFPVSLLPPSPSNTPPPTLASPRASQSLPIGLEPADLMCHQCPWVNLPVSAITQGNGRASFSFISLRLKMLLLSSCQF